MQPDLPETYYLDNVHTLFAHVSTVYEDILCTAEIEFLEGFSALGTDASKLCIRLLNRSHDCYRLGKLHYPEIETLDAAVAELAGAGFIELNGPIDRTALLALFTKPELLQALANKSGLDKLRREELEAHLLQQDDADYFARLENADDILQLLRRDEYQLCQMLFFGNLNQSMTDFVLRDLGLYQFEAYHIDPEHRPYRSRLEIQQHWLLYQLETLYQLSDLGDNLLLQQIWAQIPDDIGAQTPAYGKSERLRYDIARQLERNGDLDSALELYRRCQLPPSRERRARILAQQGRHQESLLTCIEILDTPLDEQELQFASSFAARLAKRHALSTPSSVAALRITHQPEIIDLELDYQDSVEVAVAEHYDRLDGDASCFYLENSLFNGVLGLLIWDVVFAALPGAFYNPFQFRPSDFHAHDFCSRRAELLAASWNEIRDNDDIWRIVAQRWPRKQGLLNPLVNWQDLDLDIIRLALERIDYHHWQAVFARILRDLRNNRAGFPDLVHFPPGGGYRLIEVKGPGDSLQKNQQRWMQYFRDHEIPHCIARVAWKDD